MPIIVNLDVMLAKRKMSLSQLSEQVDVTLANLSILKTNKAKPVRFSGLPAGGYSGVRGGGGRMRRRVPSEAKGWIEECLFSFV